MKKLVFIFIALIGLIGFSQSNGVPAPARYQKNIPKSALDSQTQTEINSSGTGNGNVIAVNSLSDITNAGAGAIIDVQSAITMSANFQLPLNQEVWFTTGSIDLNGYDLNFNGSSVYFSGKNLGINAFNGTLTGNVTLQNDIIYASNLGAIDDNSESTDNHQVGLNLLHITNQNSGHLFWNKQDTGIYYTLPYDINPFVGGQSPFYPNNFSETWKIGNGYDNVTVELGGDVTIKTIRNNKNNDAMFLFYDTNYSKLKGGTIQGDRYTHRYERTITIDTGASSASTVSLSINETDPFKSTSIVTTYNETISLTASTANQNATEIANYINTNLGANGYVASASGNVVTFYKEGIDFDFTITPDLTGASFSTLISTYEQGYGFYVFSNSNYCTFEYMTIKEFHGDGFATGQQGNGTSSIDFADLTQGFIDENGTVDNANTGYYYLTTPQVLPDPHDWFSFAPNAMSSADLVHFKYWMIYLDSNGNFLEKSKTLIPFEKYTPRVYKDGRPEVAKFQILVENTGTDMSGFSWFVNSISYTIGNTFKNLDIGYNRRQGVSNPGIDFKFDNCFIHDTGGAEPQYGIDIEDLVKHPMGWRIENCTFQNNANGDIIVKGGSNGVITGCFFKQDSWNLRLGWDTKGNAISTTYGRKINITDNQFEYKNIVVDIGTVFSNNQMYYSDVYAAAGGSNITGNVFENGSVNDGTQINNFNSNSAGGNSMNYVQNNIFKITDGWGNRRLVDEANSINWINNTYLFNDKSSRQYALTDSELQDVYINDSSSSYLRSDRSTTNDGVHDGITKGLYIKDLLVLPSGLHKNGWTQYANNLKDFEIEGSLKIGNGYEKSFDIRDGKVQGWFWLALGEYPIDGLGNFETITIRNLTVRVPSNIDANEGYLNNSQYGGTQLQNLLRVTQDLNVNLEFIDCKFISEDTTTGLFMYLGNRGTSLFKDCTFDAPQAENVDFTSTGSEKTVGVYAGANHGVITITNPITPGNRITFTGATIN